MEGLRLQVFSVLTICLAFINIGTVLHFSSLIKSDIDTNNSTIFGSHISLNDGQSDMMGSFVGLGAFLGSIMLPFVGNLLSRKKMMALLGIIAVGSWLGIAFSLTISTVLMFRFLAGANIGIFSVIGGAYCVEIVNPNIRGLLCSLLGFSVAAGLAFSATTSYFIHYYSAAILNSCICGLFLICLSFIPESPGYFITKGKDAQASDVLHRLRSNEKASIEMEIELCHHMNKESNEKSICGGLIQPKNLKKMAVIFAISIVRGFGGYDILTANAFRILRSLGSSMDESLASIIIFASQMPSSLIFSFCLIDRIGRKNCLYLSCAIVSLSQFCLAGFSFFNESVNSQTQFITRSNMSQPDFEHLSKMGSLEEEEVYYLPIFLLLTSYAGFCFGLQSVPYLFMAEYFPTWIRSQAAAICSAFCCILQFLSLQAYSPIISLIDTCGLFLVTAIFTMIGIPVTFYLVKETTGEDIG